ncbi:response regulator transcription factor [Nocardioides sp. AX2bis]|uniref:response regulator transcription factor n=1 Tax=Nocardioides sp. AX2bis TaxID=2653157 RepID=UPI0012F0FB30|nr:response regulator transcription factor [Nocardioides sp. AX2bis]VXB30690.1 Transcriptional regulatory protein PrrA [Nocardioides sp. AX2bis]
MPPPSATTTRDAAGPRILVVEDDDAIRSALEHSFAGAGYAVRGLPDGEALEAEVTGFSPALVVLDWMLPGRDGPALVEVVRRRSDAAIVMLTAREAVEDRLLGFDVGVDDYLAKPFVVEELLARVRAVLRRTGAIATTVVVDDLEVDEGAGRATRAGHHVPLTATEFRLLVFLAQHRDRVLSNAQILSQVWGYDEYADNLVQVHLSALRRKIEVHGPRLIHTERGLGYVLRAPRG